MPEIVSVGLQLLFITTDHYLTFVLNNNNDVNITLQLDIVILTCACLNLPCLGRDL